jgi:putative two-component system response regulator
MPSFEARSGHPYEIPDGIRLKKGCLSSQKREIMQNHPAIGGDTLLELREEMEGGGPFLSRAIEITLGHHEKWDGTGLPVRHPGQGDRPVGASGGVL